MEAELGFIVAACKEENKETNSGGMWGMAGGGKLGVFR